MSRDRQDTRRIFAANTALCNADIEVRNHVSSSYGHMFCALLECAAESCGALRGPSVSRTSYKIVANGVDLPIRSLPSLSRPDILVMSTAAPALPYNDGDDKDKKSTIYAGEEAIGSVDTTEVNQVDEKENRDLLRKIDWHLMPLLCFVYGLQFVSEFERQDRWQLIPSPWRSVPQLDKACLSYAR
jgi:hypothetical protein